MSTFFAGAVVVSAALYLVAFGVLALLMPSTISGYLQQFASSLRLHLLELLARLVVGAAFVGYAAHMQLGSAFRILGWILVFTTLGLALLPWRWHQRFAQASVPAALRFLPVMAVVSIAAGALVVWAVAGVAVAQKD
jgi:hypothetical protein